MPYASDLAGALQAAYSKGHMVICASQCPFGGVSDSYAAGSWQYEYHVIAGGRLTITIEEPEPSFLFSRFAYETT